MSEFEIYEKTQKAEMRPVTDKELAVGLSPIISVSPEDEKNGSPHAEDFIARNPKNHNDQWLVSGKFVAENYRKSKGGTFGEAIEMLKAGKLVTRSGWNGKGMFLFMRPGDELPMKVVYSAVYIPHKVKQYFSMKKGDRDKIKVTPYICMKAADDSIVNGWLASQTDMLSNDWQEFKMK